MRFWLHGLGALLAATSAEAQVCASPAVAPSTSAVSSPAPPPASSLSAAAREAFARGVRLFRAGDSAGAAEAFACAHRLSSDYRLLYNMAQVEADRGHHAAALQLLSSYLDQGGARIEPQRREEAAREQARLRQQAAALRVATSAEEAELWIDGAYAGALPSGLVWLDPGEHQVAVQAHGHAPARRAITLLPGERRLLALPLRTPSPAPASGTRDPAVHIERTGPDLAPLWLSVGAAGAAGGLAILFSVLARSADAKLERELRHYPAREAELGAARSRLRTLSAVSDASLGVTAAAASLSLYFALRPSVGAGGAGASSGSLRVAPLGLGASLRGSF